MNIAVICGVDPWGELGIQPMCDMQQSSKIDNKPVVVVEDVEDNSELHVDKVLVTNKPVRVYRGTPLFSIRYCDGCDGMKIKFFTLDRQATALRWARVFTRRYIAKVLLP